MKKSISNRSQTIISKTMFKSPLVKLQSFLMDNKVSLLLLLVICMLSSCGIFRRGCHCPKVSYTTPHQLHTQKNG